MLSTTISSILGREHARDLRREARRARASVSPVPHGVTIRPATSADHEALARLAQLDSRPMPTGQVLLAEVDGEPRAALALGGGEPVADPFHPTAALASLLELRARQMLASEVATGLAAARHHLVAVAGR
jgi:hypothetical protein